MSEGARQPPRGGTQPASSPRTSSSANLRVMSAARAAPPPQEKQGPLSERLKSGAANQALNLLATLKEAVRDFRQQDRFFKYKAFIVAGWVLVSAGTFGLACPQGAQTGVFGARILPDVPGRSSLSIENTSDKPWREVTLIVNGQWRASLEEVPAGEILTVTPKQLLGSKGAAPADLRFIDVEMRTEGGRAQLRKDGRDL
jgi:hypothetical protein